MSIELRNRLYNELDQLVLIDPHTHIDPLQPASATLADILGYHYYTELAYSAGMPKSQIEDPNNDAREKCRRLIENLGSIDNTIQYSWFVEMAQRLFGFEGDRITADNWESVYDAAEDRMAAAEWPRMVLETSKLEKVFLTNNFDDPLDGFDTDVYVPCLRTDDLVFQLTRSDVRERLEQTTGVSVGDVASLRSAIGALFSRFCGAGARACAISLPPTFQPAAVSEGRAGTAIDAILRKGDAASEADQRASANFVFWMLAEHCTEFRMPFDLMIGVNRGVFEEGVFQGRDLYDSRLSLIQYKALFNAFPRVVFPISVLASVTNQELTSYAWIFPNVVTNGHWWYSNTPTFIEHDAAARLEAVPRTKQIGYYSDMYKLEFALPKFNMYKRILAKILAERFVVDRGWTEQQAVELGVQVLRGNVESVFFAEGEPATSPVEQNAAAPAFAAAGAGDSTELAKPSETDELDDTPSYADPPSPVRDKSSVDPWTGGELDDDFFTAEPADSEDTPGDDDTFTGGGESPVGTGAEDDLLSDDDLIAEDDLITDDDVVPTDASASPATEDDDEEVDLDDFFLADDDEQNPETPPRAADFSDPISFDEPKKDD